MNTAAQFCFLLMVVKKSFRTLSVAEVHSWPALKPDCIAEKVWWDSKWSVICLLTWLSKTLKRSENVVVKDEDFRIFGGLPKPGFRHG